MKRINDLRDSWHYYNEEDFGGKLEPITILIKTNPRSDGWYEHCQERKINKSIVVTEHCWKEDCVEGTLLHEMIHQYQDEVMGTECDHGAVFRSIARHLERKYGEWVR